mgnify:CR=1 FL=1
MKWLTIEGQAWVGLKVIDETKAALLKPVVGVGMTEWHEMPTINLVGEYLMMQVANSNMTSWSEQGSRKG